MLRPPSRRDLLIAGSGAASGFVLRARSAAAAALPIKIANAVGGLVFIMGELMRQEKFLDSVGLDAQILGIADGSMILGGLVGGTADASMMSGFGQVFPAVEKGAPLKIIGGGSMSPNLAMFTGKQNIQSLKDLEGRTVGTGSIGALVYQLSVTLLRKYNVDTTKVRFVNIGSNSDIFRAVSAGIVDAGCGETYLIDDAEKYHVRLVPHGNMAVEIPEFTSWGAWTSDHAIATKREALVRALVAYAKLYRFAQNPNSKEAFLNASRTAFPHDSEEDNEAKWNYVQTYKPFASDPAMTAARLQYMQNLNVGFHIQKTVLPLDRIADMSLAADALKLLS